MTRDRASPSNFSNASITRSEELREEERINSGRVCRRLLLVAISFWLVFESWAGVSQRVWPNLPGSRASCATREDFPEPDSPATKVMRCSLMFFRIAASSEARSR